jgi:cytochrome oxidase assembly protein ShyY1
VYRFLLAPRWLALHAGLVVVVVAFAVLGRWQWDAAGLRESQQERPADPTPVELSSVAAPGQPLRPEALGRTVTVRGRYDAAQQLLVPGRELDGRAGAHVVTPLVTAGHAIVPVRRGWVSGPDDPGAAVTDGEVTVTGVLQPSEAEQASRSRPGTALPEGQLPVLSTAELMRELDDPPERLYEGYVALTAQSPAAAPTPALVPADPLPGPGGVSRWRNLSYAGQWWLFAAAAVFLWASYVRNAVAGRRTAQRAPTP